MSAAYTSSKAALLNMATVLSLELNGTRIGVSVVCPGVVETSLPFNALRARPKEVRDSPASSVLDFGMSPSAVARAMLQGIQEDRFFIFTHADYRAAIAADTELMLAAMERSADPGYREPATMVTPIRR
jgi:short-subunit dehydrogenase